MGSAIDTGTNLTLLPGGASSSGGPGEDALVAAARAGDRAAFEELVRREQRTVWRVAARICGEPAEAEDLAQRVFLLAWERLGELRGAFHPWVLGIAARLASSHRRSWWRRERADPDRFPEPAAPGSPVDAALELARRRARVRSALAALPRLQREVVLLRIDGELPFAQIAQVLGTTENSARVSHHHALSKLRERLGGDDDAL